MKEVSNIISQYLHFHKFQVGSKFCLRSSHIMVSFQNSASLFQYYSSSGNSSCGTGITPEFIIPVDHIRYYILQILMNRNRTFICTKNLQKNFSILKLFYFVADLDPQAALVIRKFTSIYPHARVNSIFFCSRIICELVYLLYAILSFAFFSISLNTNASNANGESLLIFLYVYCCVLLEY